MSNDIRTETTDDMIRHMADTAAADDDLLTFESCRRAPGRTAHPMLSATLASMTAFDTVEQLWAHVTLGGKAPSFRGDNLAGVALSEALRPHGIRCTIWS